MRNKILMYFIGTAGSGKSTLTHSYYEWCQLQGLDATLVNLDPGAEFLPYTPDVDIRDWISLKDVMETYELGPNGAQIACADMIALNIEDIKASIDSFKAEYTLIDTPGQLELFVFREAGKYTVEFLFPEQSVLCYLLDPALAKTPSGFVTQLLLSVTTNFRLQYPQINILTKIDSLSEEEQNVIRQWSHDPESLYSAVIAEDASVYREMSEKIVQMLDQFGGYSELLFTSKKDHQGIDDVYNAVQQLFSGGEDTLKD